ncbi:TIR domain-containing protein [Nocardia colli]|uniref:TIR domain-containing protein n=2 Tax=Nocardia colli TaxID=2545717 RepID=A0A5N0EMG5_9NOCA|nr:TIR domain-containing protein [Nocardia colli]
MRPNPHCRTAKAEIRIRPTTSAAGVQAARDIHAGPVLTAKRTTYMALRRYKLRPDLGYGAFLSYSGDRDRALLPKLQKAMETLPRRWYRPPITRTFLDYSGVSIGPTLWEKITTGLAKSDWLVVCASPEAQRSEWVDREIEWWLDNRSVNSILLVVTDGALVWDKKANDWDREQSTALPPRLLGRYPTQPVWKTVTWRGPDKTGPDIDSAAVSITAVVRGIREDDLHSEGLRETRRNLRWAMSAVAVLAVLTLVATLTARVAVVQRNHARDLAAESLAARLVQDAHQQFTTVGWGSYRRAVLEVLAAQHFSPELVEGAVIDAQYRTQGLAKIVDLGPGGEVASISPDGHWLATGYPDGLVRLWDVGSAVALDMPGRGTRRVRAVAVTPDGRRVVVGDDKGGVQVWDVAHHTVIDAPHRSAGSVASVAITPDGRRVVAGDGKGTVWLWDVDGGDFAAGPMHAAESIAAVTVSEDGRGVAVGDNGGVVQVWDTASGAVSAMPGGGTYAISAVAISSDTQWISAGDDHGDVRAWDRTQNAVAAMPNRDPSSITALAVTAQGHRVLSGNESGVLRRWDVESDAVATAFYTASSAILDMTPASDGDRVAVVDLGGGIRLWDSATSTTTPIPAGFGAGGEVAVVAVCPDAQRAVAGGPDGSVVVWNPRDQTIVASAHPADAGIRAVAISAAAPRAAVADARGGVWLWDTESGKMRAMPGVGDAAVWSLALTPDGGWLVTADVAGTVRWWGADSGQLVTMRGADPNVLRSVSIDAAGDRVAIGGTDGTVQIWEPQRDKTIAIPNKDPVPVQAVAITPDGSRVVAGDTAGSIQYWDITSGRVSLMPSADAVPVWGVAVSADGRRAASTDGVGMVRLWDTDHRQATTAVVSRYLSPARSVSFDSVSGSLVTGTANGVGRIESLSAKPAELCARLMTTMSTAEWRIWVSNDSGFARVELCDGLREPA